MKLTRITAPAVLLALTLNSIPLHAEEREGILVPQPVLASRSVGSGMVASDRQLVQVPSPVQRMHGVQPSVRALMWTVVGVGAAFAGLMTFAYATGLNRD
jgi:hypothetical protein